jgi:hypothetical protein
MVKAARIVNIATTLPSAVFGVISPYPTVDICTKDKRRYSSFEGTKNLHPSGAEACYYS